MSQKIYAIMPESAFAWERRRVEALARIPKAELCDEDKKAITDFIDANKEYIRQYLGMFYNQRRPLSVVNGVAYIHVNDFVGRGLTYIDRCIGGTDYGDVIADITAARNDPAVKCVLVDFDSGGGGALGCVETGRAMAELDAEKVCYSYVNTVSGSAAFAIACGTSGIYGEPSVVAGCIGSLMKHFDYEKMLEKEGIGFRLYRNEGADLKGAGVEFRRPTDAEDEFLQSTADEYGMQFQLWVASRRGNIPAAGYRGQWLSGRQSVEMHYMDGIMSRPEMVAMLEGIASIG